MDILIYVLVCLVWGFVNCARNEGFTMDNREDSVALDENGGDLVNLSEIPIGSNLTAHYNANAFNRIVDQFHLR